MLGDVGFAVLVEGKEINAFIVPGGDLFGLIEWSRQRLDDKAEVGSVSEADTELVTYLRASGNEPTSYMCNFEMDLTEGVLVSGLGSGWDFAMPGTRKRRTTVVRRRTGRSPRRWIRKRISIAICASCDLRSTTTNVIWWRLPPTEIAAFMVWWSDPSGIALIEPFGTHPDFHRQGVGSALLRFGLARMQAAGMRTVRVCTEESREVAVAFYASVGFRQGPRLGWWGLR